MRVKDEDGNKADCWKVRLTKENEDALWKSEERYRVLVENSLQGLAIIQESQIVYCNRAYAAITGYSVEELLRFSDSTQLVHPDDRAMVRTRYKDRLSGEEIDPRYEHRIIRKDGADRWLEIYASLVEYGGSPAVQILMIDITERKNAEMALRASENRFSTFFHKSPLGIAITSLKDNRILDSNSAFQSLTGYSKQEILGHTALELNLWVDPKEREQLMRQLLESGTVSGFEVQIRKKSGKIAYVLFSSEVIDLAGERSMLSMAQDITGQKSLEAQFLQAQKMEVIGMLAGGVAHDFNNQLTVIRGYAEILLQELAPDDLMRGDIETIEKACRQSAFLTSKLLAFSRNQLLQLEILDLNKAVAEASTILGRMIGEDVELVTVAGPDLGSVNADPARIQQILMNLAVNARDAMPKGGILTIETANVNFDEAVAQKKPSIRPGSFVMLAVSDNGIGMDDATQVRLFEPFFTTKPKGKGTGLGLSTVLGIVEQSRGFICVDSEVGKGSTFRIYLPRVERGASEPNPQHQSDFAAEKAETVLVVEDETTVRELMTRILAKYGYVVIEATNGNNALEVAQNHTGNLSLVLTDVVMPGMNGRELVSRLRAIRPQIRALYVSGHMENSAVQQGLLDPHALFLQKPFTVEGLLQKVRQAIAG